ncbi:thiamine diphosphokinase [Paracoccus sp. Z330]|uniref:Thiamine diphosphokinase n=1 Tax=Paracoccus onchidii TaxID=3017813 RepID=A0ABT4ZEK4_9RHOB|nr:thiamine diphosphokinase [Paracoccus onchidii]MDB6177805.1 thiamine diphosphokinase [Paracoccus onchidii]
MNAPVVRSDRGVTIVGGGAVSPEDLKTALSVAPLLVAADGGADRAMQLGYQPDWVIGDLDSISDRSRRSIASERLCHVAEQDSTDFTKSLTRISAPFTMAVGFAGLRLDHTLAALTAMANIAQPVTIMIASDDIVFVAPPRIHLPLAEDVRVSLYPLGAARGRSRGLQWPIDGIDFSPEGRIGTSNRATGPVDLEVEGKMLVMLPRTQLANVMIALGLVAE